jgi:hypothetical protein
MNRRSLNNNSKLSFVTLKACLWAAFGLALFGPPAGHAQQTRSALKSVTEYAATLAPFIALRPITVEERARVDSGGAPELGKLLRSWTRQPQFSDSVRLFVETRYSFGGNEGGIDHNEPANLAVFLEKTGRPWTEFLTSTSCVDSNGQQKACDSQAPFTAGVLTSRSFLAQHAGAFNISRSAKLLKKFTCQEYPLSSTLEPPVPTADLIDLFSSPNGAITFGNGKNCAACHSQFAKHAQLFVKFDSSGRYKASATGLQNPDPQASGGSSTNGTYVSHFRAPERAQRENSEVFGKTVANLAEAAKILAEHPTYHECAARNMIWHYLRMNDTTAKAIPTALVSDIAVKARALGRSPTFSDLLVTALAHPVVIESYTKHGKRGEE